MYTICSRGEFMVITLSKWGNSQGIRLPKELLQQVDFLVGASAEVEVKNGEIIIKPIKKKIKYDIKELVKDISVNENREVDWGSREGNEIW